MTISPLPWHIQMVDNISTIRDSSGTIVGTFSNPQNADFVIQSIEEASTIEDKIEKAKEDEREALGSQIENLRDDKRDLEKEVEELKKEIKTLERDLEMEKEERKE